MDAVLDKAVDLAREVAIEVADGEEWVGEHLSANRVEDRLVTHLFACTMPGYRGWVWAVTVSRAPRGREAAVCEAHLVPADDALLAPAWIPWADRIRPGDLEPSMVLPKIEEDPRLEPGYESHDADEDIAELWELGLGRERVMAPRGRDAAAERWYRGSHGPTASSAVASASPCSTCAFFVPLTGSFRTTFGACANEWSPSDGKVVSVDHGCGAHSQTDVERQSTRWPDAEPIFENDGVTPVDMSKPDPEPQPEPVAEPVAEPAAELAADAQADATSENAAAGAAAATGVEAQQGESSAASAPSAEGQSASPASAGEAVTEPSQEADAPAESRTEEPKVVAPEGTTD
ncbi:DUF3027 domain-containing protein [Demequina globuliformis]|uniref:DUF3027 domain-containing protein n=1 Tax=Demequina globuliformis TaxID=676202 RepID=UPI000782DB9F|nr:DUF3027 domain-containing protein [Demequina globuliformis]